MHSSGLVWYGVPCSRLVGVYHPWLDWCALSWAGLKWFIKFCDDLAWCAPKESGVVWCAPSRVGQVRFAPPWACMVFCITSCSDLFWRPLPWGFLLCPGRVWCALSWACLLCCAPSCSSLVCTILDFSGILCTILSWSGLVCTVLSLSVMQHAMQAQRGANSHLTYPGRCTPYNTTMVHTMPDHHRTFEIILDQSRIVHINLAKDDTHQQDQNRAHHTMPGQDVAHHTRQAQKSV